MEVNPAAGSRQMGMQFAVEDLLHSLEPELAKAIFLGAIPHWTNQALLQRITGTVDLSYLIETLVKFQFARLDSRDRIHYREGVRPILLDGIRRNAPRDFLAASRIAHQYFSEIAQDAVATERPALLREALYHLLVVDESAGMALLNEKLEEAIYFRQRGEAEMLLAQARQLQEQLSDRGQSWLQYFEATLDLVYRRNDDGKAAFQTLIQNAQGQVLRSLARWKLGQVCVKAQRWSEAIGLYKESLKELSDRGEEQTHYQARVLMSLGEAYDDLAEQSGGLLSISVENYGTVSRVFHLLMDLPFRLLEWLVHRIGSLPSLYFKANYQDWIIAFLLSTAGHWFHRAEQLFALAENPLELTEARLALAKVDCQMGNLSRAWHRYALLEQMPVIRQSRYRTARVHLGQSHVLRQQGKLGHAIALLKESAETFLGFQDMSCTAAACYQLGQAYSGQSNLSEATDAFIQSATLYRQERDWLAVSRAMWKLEMIARRSQLPAGLLGKIAAALGQFPERHSLTRFPARIIRLYRRLALLLALPLSYGLTLLLVMLSIAFLTILLEVGVIESNVATLVNIFWLALLIMLAAWAGRGVYSITGLAAVYLLGYKLARIEQEQPIHLALDEAGISSYSERDAHQEQQSSPPAYRLAWDEVTEYISLDFMIRRQPIYLISRTILKAGSRILIIEGMTAGYDSFKRDIQNALANRLPAVKLNNHNFTFLESWSTLGTLLFSLLLTVGLYLMGRIEITSGQNSQTPLRVTTIVAFTTSTLVPALIAVIFWRLWFHRIRLEKNVEYQDTVIPTGLLLAAAILSTLIVLIWILLQAVIL